MLVPYFIPNTGTRTQKILFTNPNKNIDHEFVGPTIPTPTKISTTNFSGQTIPNQRKKVFHTHTSTHKILCYLETQEEKFV